MATAKLFKDTVKAYRRSLTLKQRQAAIKAPAMKYPFALERKYARQITEFLTPLIAYVENYYKQNGERIVRGDRLDAVPGEEFSEYQRQLDAWMSEYYPDDSEDKTIVYASIIATASALKIISDKAIGGQLKPIVGFEFALPDTWWATMQSRWAADNYKLIKNLADEYIKKINIAVENAIQSGVSYKTLMSDIKDIGIGISDSRAKLIAVDQIGKLNGLITHNQMTEAGIEMYTWTTVGDERVRGKPGGRFAKAIPSHWVMQNVLCRWDDASVYSDDGGKTWKNRGGKMPLVHPGQAIRCRCMAIPYFKEYLAQVDSEIAA